MLEQLTTMKPVAVVSDLWGYILSVRAEKNMSSVKRVFSCLCVHSVLAPIHNKATDVSSSLDMIG